MTFRVVSVPSVKPTLEKKASLKKLENDYVMIHYLQM